MYAIRMVQMVVPVITIPYLARILSIGDYAHVALIQSTSLLTALIIEFGFSLSGAKEIAEAQSSEERSVIVAEILTAKALLVMPVVLAVGILTFIQGTTEISLVFIVVLGASQAFTPLWFFQGTQSLGRYMIVETLIRVGSFLVMFLVVPRSGAVGYLSLISLTNVVLVVVQHQIMYARGLRFAMVDLATGIKRLRNNLPLAVFRIGSSFYTTGSLVVLSFFVSGDVFAIYAGIEKLFRASLNVLSPITDVLYPMISRRQSRSAVLYSGGLTLGVAALLALVLYFLSPQLIHLLLDDKFVPGWYLLRNLSICPLLIAMGTIIYMYVLLPRNEVQAFLTSTVVAGGVTIGLIATLTPRYGSDAMPFILAMAEVTVI